MVVSIKKKNQKNLPYINKSQQGYIITQVLHDFSLWQCTCLSLTYEQ